MGNDFSVLMSVFHKEKPSFLRDALNSLVDQTVPPKEIVLVKDGPLTEELDVVIDSFMRANPGILRIVSQEQNVGLGRALEIGLEHCSYELVARMDTDDISCRDRFEHQLKFLNDHPEISIVGGAIQEFNNEPGDLNRFRRLPSGPDKLAQFAKLRSPLNHVTVMFRKSDIKKAGSYQHFQNIEDYYLWARVLVNGFKIDNIENNLVLVRVGNDMVGRRHGLSYLGTEIRLLSAFRKMGFLNFYESGTWLATRLFFRLLPKGLLSFLYGKVLRRK